MKRVILGIFVTLCFALAVTSVFAQEDNHDNKLTNDKLNIEARPPFHIKDLRNLNITSPAGYSPSQVKTAYNLPSTGGSGVVAIVDAYDNPNAEKDLGTFSSQFGLLSCTSSNGCFIKHKMSGLVLANSGWALEESLDVQWVHALAPNAKILLVEARTSKLSDLLSAVSYAKSYPGVVSVSMSWGSNEFSGSSAYDSYFSQPNVTFFASSGDSGTGVQWPAVSSNVTGVGGTTLTFSGAIASESAWNGSGGGISSYVSEPSYQSGLVTNTNNKRAVPDVSFVADPNTGVSVYDSYSYGGQRGWFVIGGTSVGSPSWAAIKALSSNVVNGKLYQDAVSSYATFFRDITSGTNGSCGVVCTASTGYDFVTGLGSPITTSF